jgi:glutaredoxin
MLRLYSLGAILILLCLPLPGGPYALDGRPAGVAGVASAQPQVEIEVFVREGCPHCAKAEEFLAKLTQERPGLRIVVHDVGKEPGALGRLQQAAENAGLKSARVPAFAIGGRVILGFSDELTSGRLVRDALDPAGTSAAPPADAAGSCEAEASLACGPDAPPPAAPQTASGFEISFLGRTLALDDIGLPLFTLAMGLLDGFNPCSMWVLVLMISLLAPMHNRGRMFAVAGTFVLVEGIAYFLFMAAWLNLFLFIGLSRVSQIVIAAIAIVAGAINLKDFWGYGGGVSLSIPQSAKPGIYTRIRAILQAKNLTGAIIGAIVLAVLVQIVEFLCTSGFPALFTRILTLEQPGAFGYYGYLLLYNLAYMLDDIIVLSIGVITLSQRRLQEKEGRWLKLMSGVVMVGLGVYLLIT